MTTLALCRLDELAEGTAKRFDVEGQRLALARIGDDVYCVADRCSQEDFSLSEGEILPAECEIECARHGATFDLKTGAAMSLPATKPVATYDVTIVDGVIEVEVP